MAQPNHVVVVGGGLAGMASAVWLAEAGQRVTLLERRASLGGRTHAIAVPQVDDVADNGQHIMTPHFHHLFRYLDSVGTRHHMHFEPIANRWPGGGAEVYSVGLRAQWQSLTGRIPGAPGGDRMRTMLAQLRLIRQSLSQPDELDQMTVEEWYDRVKLPATARRFAWDLAATGILNEKPHLASAKALADTLAALVRLGRQHGNDPLSFGYSNVDYDTLYVHGAQRLLSKSGHHIHYRAVVRNIDIVNGVATGVTLSDGTSIKADAVVCAVPAWKVYGLLDQLPEHERVYAAANKLPPAPIVSVNLYLDRPLSTVSWMENIIDGGGIVEAVFDRQRIHAGHRNTERGFLYALTTSAAYELNKLTNAEITHKQMEFLGRYYPEARSAQVVHAHIVRMNAATFTQRPGTAGIRPLQATTIPNVVLAGDWTRTDWCSTMEGAAQSAARAVEALLASLPKAGNARLNAAAALAA